MPTKRLSVALVIVAVAATGVVTWRRDDVTPAAGPSLRAVVTTPASNVWFSSSKLPFPNLKNDAPMSEQVDALLATHDPEKAMVAYRLLSNCDEFNRLHDRLIFDIEEIKDRHPGSLPGYRGMTDTEKEHDTVLCSTMTERMRVSRIDYLAIAAEAGVSGAAVSFALEGPFGDKTALTSRPDDPLVREWKEKARAQLTRDAEAADLMALHHVWSQNLSGDGLYEKNVALAFRYGLAMGKIYEDINGADDAMNRLYGEKSLMMQSITKDMSPEQRAAEVAEAQRIAEIARQHRKRAGGKA